MYPFRTRKPRSMLPGQARSPAKEVKPTPGLEPGTPSLRVKRVHGADSAISLQSGRSIRAAESVGVHGSPQRSSDVFQRCSNRSTSGSAASVAFCPDTSSGVAPHRTRRRGTLSDMGPLPAGPTRSNGRLRHRPPRPCNRPRKSRRAEPRIRPRRSRSGGDGSRARTNAPTR